MIFQTSNKTIVEGSLTIDNPHRVMIRINEHSDHRTVDTKTDHALIGNDRPTNIVVNENGSFTIGDLL